MKRLAAGLLIWAACASSALAQNVRWEIEPKEDPRAPSGKVAVFGGTTGPAGVRLVLRDLKIESPIQFLLAAEDPARPLEMIAYKDRPEQPLLQQETGATGDLTLRFRTANEVEFRITGPEGAGYQAAVWVGPAFDVNRPQGLTSMKEHKASFETPVPPAPVPAASMAAPPAAASEAVPVRASESPATIVLLSLIFLALAVIAFRLSRGRPGGRVALLLLAGTLGSSTLQAQEHKPRPIPPG